MSITAKHSANIGDLIASLAGLRQYWYDTQERFVYCQQLNVESVYFQDAQHPTKDNGKQVMCNRSMFEMIKPLLLAQPYIEDFVEYVGQKVVINLDKIRGETFVNMPGTAIQSWYFYAFPDLATDISQAWIHVPNSFNIYDKYADKILINFTCRYRNNFIDYFFLKEHQDKLIFTGTEQEHKDFCAAWNIEIPLLVVEDFLELAKIMKQCKFFLGNQSFCWNLANAIGVPRIVECFQLAPNCVPFVGKDNYGFYHQGGLEYYFNKLNK
jgi:hypothetical protein